jgi:glycosyltransferase involved in cell wall biosynthesis
MTTSGFARHPRVSVCIPTYNGASYLSRALECVNKQTFDDFEVVIIDDCSADGTVAIAEQYVAAEPRARLIRNKVRAGSSARNANRCIEESRGEWIKFLFQDDLMTADCLEKMLAASDRGPLVISSHGYVFSDGTTDEVRAFYETLPTLEGVFPGSFATADEVCTAIMRNPWINFIGPTSASLIHRRCFTKYGRFHAEIVYFPDLELWMRVGTNEGVTIVREQLTAFGVHEGSTSGRMRSDSLRDFRCRLDWMMLVRSISDTPEYERLRECALRWDPPFDPALEVRNGVIDTRWEAMDANYRQRDRRLIHEFDALCNRDPGIRAILQEYEASLPLWTKFKDFLKTRDLSAVTTRR